MSATVFILISYEKKNTTGCNFYSVKFGLYGFDSVKFGLFIAIRFYQRELGKHS